MSNLDYSILDNEDEMQYKAQRWLHWAWGLDDLKENMFFIKQGYTDKNDLNVWLNFIYWLINRKDIPGIACWSIVNFAGEYAPLDIFKYMVQCYFSNKDNRNYYNINRLFSSKLSIENTCWLLNEFPKHRLAKSQLINQYSIKQIIEIYDRLLLHQYKPKKIFKSLYQLVDTKILSFPLNSSTILTKNSDKYSDEKSFRKFIISNSTVQQTLNIYIHIQEIVINIIVKYLK